MNRISERKWRLILLVVSIGTFGHPGRVASVRADTPTARVVVWGENHAGQTNVPATLQDPVAIAAGGYFCLALDRDGHIVGWGDEHLDRLDIPSNLSNVVALAAGSAHGVALKRDKTVVCWGDKYWGQSDVPPDLTNVAAIAASDTCTAALKIDGTVILWGHFTDGDFGSGIPVFVPPGITNIVDIAAGAGHVIALRSDGTVAVWGGDYPVRTNVPPGLSNIVAIAAGGGTSLAVKRDGTVVQWGEEWYGTSNTPPVYVTNIIAVASGLAHNLGLREDGTVAAWGYNCCGQTVVPTGLDSATAIAASVFNSMALLSDGSGPPSVKLQISRVNEAILLSFPTAIGKTYVLEWTESLESQTWKMTPILHGDGVQHTLSFGVQPAQQFYRIAVH